MSVAERTEESIPKSVRKPNKRKRAAADEPIALVPTVPRTKAKEPTALDVSGYIDCDDGLLVRLLEEIHIGLELLLDSCELNESHRHATVVSMLHRKAMAATKLALAAQESV